MNVCFYRHTLLNRGGDKMVIEYANHLYAQGHEVCIESVNHDTVYTVNVPVMTQGRFASRLGTILDAAFRKRNYDIIIADIVPMALLLSLRNRGKVVYFAQDYDEAYYRSPFLKALIRFIFHITLRILRVPVIAVSDQVARRLHKYRGKKVTVVKNGLDESVFFPEKDEAMTALAKGANIVLVFARSDYRKGFDITIKALSHLSGELEAHKVEVWAVGEHLPTPFSVRHFGYVSPAELRTILSTADILLYPSRHEGFGLFILEAMACGCAVITSDAVPEEVHRGAAVVCAVEDAKGYADAIKGILADRRYHGVLIEKGMITAKEYSLSASKIEFQEVLEQLACMTA
jgi:glycosyltransferase involved in cell wall biosynthesis